MNVGDVERRLGRYGLTKHRRRKHQCEGYEEHNYEHSPYVSNLLIEIAFSLSLIVLPQRTSEREGRTGDSGRAA